ncbi:MAG TPA: 3-oxoacyl-[acyl-carrier-protein] synthase III C-terminal domain-containing protein [Nannocystaceae bacterium]|nr:3-oxoacyl-[acyl-carrier-protein] synthase III C-terminal domain-containing protein [Nannocystaceae bacterium]
MSVLAAVATAVPPHVFDQAEARAFARRMFATMPGIDRLLGAFENTGIARRHIVQPLSWYEEPRTFVEKNAVWQRSALSMAQQACARALAAASVPRDRIAAIVFVTSTGIATPSLDAQLVQVLELPRSIARVPVWGLGCAGGAAGLARADALCRGLDAPVLLVAVEVCSATFVARDRSKSNLIATALFADGAAAAVITPHGDGPQLLGGHAQLLDGTADVMGWTVHDDGLQVRFARSIPQIVRELAPSFVRDAAAKAGVSAEAIEHYVLHPGGAKVLQAYQSALALPQSRLAASWDVLRTHGNMSSPTALFVLDAFLRARPQPGLGLVIGLGPGFCAESVVLRT